MNRFLRTIRNPRAAIDLVSIMVGVIVVSIIAGMLSATVFAVIPWAQNQAANTALTEVVEAETLARVPQAGEPLSGRYLNSANLQTAGLYTDTPQVGVDTDPTGSCYIAAIKSGAGRVFWLSDTDRDPRVYLNDTSPCADLPGLVASLGGSNGLISNLATNPSNEKVAAGTTVLRTNLTTTPTPAVTSSQFGFVAGAGGATSAARVPGVGPAKSGFFYRATWSAATTTASGVFGAAATPVTPKSNYTGSGYVRRSVSRDVRASLEWRDAGNAIMGNANGTVTTATAGQWVRVSATGTAPAGAATVTVTFYSQAPTIGADIGETADVDAVLLEQTDQLRPYIDGNTPDVLGWDYGWSGTPYTSTTTAKAGHSEVRRNLVNNPRATAYSTTTAGATGWSTLRYFGHGGGAGNYSLVTGATDGPLPYVTTYARKTWTAAPDTMANSNETGFQNSLANGVGGLPVTVGDTYTMSVYMRPSVQRQLRFGVYQYDAAGAASSAGTVVDGPMDAGSPNVWTRVSYTYTVPAGVSFISINSDSDRSAANGAVNWSVGSTFDATALLLEKVGVVRPYFDGRTPSTGDFNYTWFGATDNSLSAQIAPTTASSGQTNFTGAYQSSVGFGSGTHSLAVQRREGTTSDVYIQSLLPINPSGKTYSYRLRAYVPTTTTLYGDVTASNNAYGWLGLTPIAPSGTVLQAGVTEFRGTFTAGPSQGTNVRFILRAGVNGEPVYWDDVMLVEEPEPAHPYTGEYRDGNTTGWKWSGAPYESESSGY